MIDYDYNEHARMFLEESKSLRREYDRKEKRRLLWLGKIAFPKVDTKKTKLLYMPPDCHLSYFPIVEPLAVTDFRSTPSPYTEEKRAEIKLERWGYNGNRWRAVVRFGYYERDDVLVVCKGTLLYQRAHKFSDGDTWWTKA